MAISQIFDGYRDAQRTGEQTYMRSEAKSRETPLSAARSPSLQAKDPSSAIWVFAAWASRFVHTLSFDLTESNELHVSLVSSLRRLFPVWIRPSANVFCSASARFAWECTMPGSSEQQAFASVRSRSAPMQKETRGRIHSNMIPQNSGEDSKSNWRISTVLVLGYSK